MKISGLYIDGFGIFRNQALHDLPDRLVVIFGNNESGKSTAVSFIRSVLFGFPDGRSRENPYPPVAGGKYGGRLVVSDASRGEYIVERTAGKHGGSVIVTPPDGSIGGADMLQQLLGTATKDLFKNIYAFSLEELQTLTSLNNESVRGAIYGASAGTGIRALPDIENEIEKRMKDLFLSRGQKPEINRLLSHLKANKRELLKAQGAIDEYDRGVKRLGEIKNALAISHKDVVATEVELKKVESYLTLWEDWVGFSQAEKELSEKDEISEFPENGLARLDRLIEKQEDLRARTAQKNSKLDKLRRDLESLPHEGGLLDKKQEIERLVQGRDQYAALIESLPLKRQRIKVLEKEVTQLLTQLGTGWDESKVSGFDRSLFTREAIRNHAQRLDRAKTEKARCRALLDSAKDNHARSAHESKNAFIEDIAGEEDSLSKRKTAARTLRALLLAQSRLEAEIRHIEDRILDKKQQTGWMTAPSSIPALFLSARFSAIVAILGILAGAVLASYGQTQGGIFTAFFFLCAAGVIRLFGKQKCKAALDYQKITENIEHLNATKQEREKSLNDTLRQIEELRALLGDADLDKIESEIEKQGHLLEKAKTIQSLKEASEKELNEAKKRLDESEVHEASLLSEWKQWLHTVGFSADLSPQTALDALQIMDNILDRINARDSLSAETKENEGSVDTYTETAHSIFAACGRHLPLQPDLLPAVDNIATDLGIAEKTFEQRRLIEKDLEETKQEKEDLEKEYATIAEGISDLINAGKARDEEDFRRRGVLFQERKRLEEIISQARNNMLRISGQQDWTGLRDTLASLDKDTLLRSKSELSQRNAEMREELERLRDTRADLEAAVARMSTEDTISRLRAEEERLLETLHAKAKDWSCLAIAKHLLSEARKKFEHEQQPEVIREASAFFSTITSGKYKKIIAPPGENYFEVIDNNSFRKKVDILSRGTKEQLYLCVRFGYMRNYAAQDRPLPVIMDDILVNFDPARARTASQTIYDLSRTHQVLFFTCHPESIELFHKIDAHIPVFHLEDSGFCKRELGS